jgi:hypothetical protein
MQYEYLIRKAFHCDRFGDPLGLANADIYDTALNDGDLFRIQLGIAASLTKVAHDFDEGGHEQQVDQLRLLARQVFAANQIAQVNTVITQGSQIFQALGVAI